MNHPTPKTGCNASTTATLTTSPSYFRHSIIQSNMNSVPTVSTLYVVSSDSHKFVTTPRSLKFLIYDLKAAPEMGYKFRLLTRPDPNTKQLTQIHYGLNVRIVSAPCFLSSCFESNLKCLYMGLAWPGYSYKLSSAPDLYGQLNETIICPGVE